MVLTADATPSTKRKALALGADDFLTKPFEAYEVALRVKNLLRTRLLYKEISLENDLLEQRVKERTKELEEIQLEIVDRLGLATEYRDDDTKAHTGRVGDMASQLASALNLPVEKPCRQLVRCEPSYRRRGTQWQDRVDRRSQVEFLRALWFAP